MSDDRRFERLARTWLELGPTDPPDHVVEAALLAIESTPQERDLRIPWRLPVMFSNTRLALAAVIGVLAVYLLRPAIFGVGTPSPSPSSSARPTGSASPSASAAGVLTERFESRAFALTFAYPAGWAATHAAVIHPGIDEAVGDLDAYDAVEGDGSRFIVTAGRLASMSFEEWLAARDALGTDSCHSPVGEARSVAIGTLSGLMTDSGCRAIGPYHSWWRAVALVDGIVYVFQLDTDRSSDGTERFEAILASLAFGR